MKALHRVLIKGLITRLYRKSFDPGSYEARYPNYKRDHKPSFKGS